MEIRMAKAEDIPALGRLLYQVNEVHRAARPDLFKLGGRKYSDGELAALLRDPERPILVYDDGGVKGYAFCVLERVKDEGSRKDCVTLYLDDLCVDEAERRGGIGSAIFAAVKELARQRGCDYLTLNVWRGNDSAAAFYEKQGLTVRKTTLETKIK